MLQSSSKSKIAFVAVVCAAAVFAWSQSQPSRSILTRPAPAPDHKISYGEDPSQFGELRLPKGEGPHPVAIIIHGGCWMAEYGLGYMSHLSAALAEAGIATWSIEYRRVGNSGGGWPGTFEDAARGADYVRTLAKRYPLDIKRVTAVGHSAGGHLVLWLAARSRLPKDSPLYSADPIQLRGVVPLAAIPDLRKKGTACDQSVGRLMASPSGDADSRFAISSPIEMLPIGVKQTIVQGETDNLVPQQMAMDYAEAAKKKGDNVKLVMIEKAGHFELVDPASFAWNIVKNEVMEISK